STVDSIKLQLKGYNIVIAGLHDDQPRPQNAINFSESVLRFVGDLSRQPGSIIALFKNPYVLDKIQYIERAKGLVLAYQDNYDTEDLTAQLIFGGIGSAGRLPVSIGGKFPLGDGIDIQGGIRFKYTLPEDAGMDSRVLLGVDSLV